MEVIRKFSRALETMSREMEAVPDAFYILSAAGVLMLLVLYFFILPGLHLKEDKKQKYRNWCITALLMLYILGILTITVFTREVRDDYSIRLTFLYGIRNASHIGGAFVRALLNLALFVPMGFLFSWRFRGKLRIVKGTAAAFTLSLIIECTQLIGRLGNFETDDLLFNTIGGMLGGVLLVIWAYAFGKKSIGKIFLRGLLVLSATAVLCAGGVLGTYHFLRLSGARAVRVSSSSALKTMESRGQGNPVDSDDPGLIWFNGEAYRYNDKLTTLLFIGIDQRSEEIETKEEVSGESGQADTIFLLVLNPVNNKMKVIGISRDTMTDIKTFDYKGNYLGKSKNHLGLAYAYGDGRETSCGYMTDAVSELFYGMPIHGYVALNMEAVIKINDSVGGVTVTVSDDAAPADSRFHPGETVRLEGTLALKYIKWRDTSVPNSNNLRMARQKQYLESFLKQALQAVQTDVTLPVKLYQELNGQMVTDLGADKAVYLTTRALGMKLDSEGIMMLKGESKQGSVYDEVYVDDDALYRLILETFYVKEQK